MKAMTFGSKTVCRILAGVAMGASVLAATPADAQVAVSGGVDFPTTYYFRGAKQEVDPSPNLFGTVQPFVDVGGALMSGDGALKSVNLNVGSWNSFHFGSNEDLYDGSFYESDFYATLGLGFSNFTLATTYTAYMYPAASEEVPGGDLATIHEIAFKGSMPHKIAPYGLIAFEMEDGTDNPGTYLEFGIGPGIPLTQVMGATVTFPVRVAFDLNDYYAVGDSGFAFFGAGATAVFPINKFSIKAGIDYLALSDTLEALNKDEDGDTSSSAFVFLVGIGFSF